MTTNDTNFLAKSRLKNPASIDDAFYHRNDKLTQNMHPEKEKWMVNNRCGLVMVLEATMFIL